MQLIQDISLLHLSNNVCSAFFRLKLLELVKASRMRSRYVYFSVILNTNNSNDIYNQENSVLLDWKRLSGKSKGVFIAYTFVKQSKNNLSNNVTSKHLPNILILGVVQKICVVLLVVDVSDSSISVFIIQQDGEFLLPGLEVLLVALILVRKEILERYQVFSHLLLSATLIQREKHLMEI